MIASSFFSLMTVVVYLTLEEKRNIHGLTVVSYATSMFFMYVFLGLAHLLRYYGSDNVLKSRACVIIGKLSIHALYIRFDYWKMSIWSNDCPIHVFYRNCISPLFFIIFFVVDCYERGLIFNVSVRYINFTNRALNVITNACTLPVDLLVMQKNSANNEAEPQNTEKQVVESLPQIFNLWMGFSHFNH